MRKAWMTRPYPQMEYRMKQFQTDDMIAIGWPELGSLENCSSQEIKMLLSKDLSELQRGNAAATIERFLRSMTIGDLVLIPDGNDIYIAEIVSDYYYDEKSRAKGYPHQRKIKWLSRTTRTDLSKPLRNSLKSHRTTANLNRFIDEIEGLAGLTQLKKEISNELNFVEVSYPLRADFNIEFIIPKDMSQDEAKRLQMFFETLYFNRKK